MKKPLFDVVVIATMSAGKSTVINALIGKELLHSANEATTATITRIHDKDDLAFFSGDAYSYSNQLLAEESKITAEILRKWNVDENIKTIDLVGNVQALHNDVAELVIYDTPGPNNSQDDNHEALTMEVINDGNYGLILYVLNATQLGVNDDRHLLEKINKTLQADPHKEILFLLNKADCLDEEKGERLDKVVINAEKYLTEIGFHKPTIIPTAAHYALILQKVLNKESLTIDEEIDLLLALKRSSDNFIIASTIESECKFKMLSKLKKIKKSGRVKNEDGSTITKQRLSRAIMRTGFGVVQYLLQQRLAKNDFNSI